MRSWHRELESWLAFRGVDSISLDNVNFGWNKSHRSGEICIDQIELSR